MALFAVSYDLVSKRDYQPLWDEMERLKGQKAVLSLYLLALSNEDPKEVLDHFAQFIDGDDRLLVIKLTDAASLRCFKGTSAWITANCP
jgi:hypothetical protein